MSQPMAVDKLRERFPALATEWAYLDNAGGSQMLGAAAERFAEYAFSSMVSYGGPYEASVLGRERLTQAGESLAHLVNAAHGEEIILGSSATQLLTNLTLSLEQRMQPGDEIIVSQAEHQANVSPWERLKSRGVGLKTWPMNTDSGRLEFVDLAPLLTPRTRMVSFTHCSNILGAIHDVPGLTRQLRETYDGWICVDGVAYSPHRAVDVQAAGVDFYVVSLYKVFGPHVGLLYGRREVLLDLPGINHPFLPADAIPYKFQPGNANPELAHACTAIVDYLDDVGSTGAPKATKRENIERAYQAFATHEAELAEQFLDFLQSKPRVRLLGPATSDANERVATISFQAEGLDASTVPAHLALRKVGVRAGNFYAMGLARSMGFDDPGGVVRISIAHYNTASEIERTIHGLDELL